MDRDKLMSSHQALRICIVLITQVWVAILARITAKIKTLMKLTSDVNTSPEEFGLSPNAKTQAVLSQHTRPIPLQCHVCNSSHYLSTKIVEKTRNRVKSSSMPEM